MRQVAKMWPNTRNARLRYCVIDDIFGISGVMACCYEASGIGQTVWRAHKTRSAGLPLPNYHGAGITRQRLAMGDCGPICERLNRTEIVAEAD